MEKEILYISHQFPSLTETFTYNEVIELKRNGLNVTVVSFKQADHLTSERLLSNIKTVYLTDLAVIEYIISLIYCWFKRPLPLLKIVWGLATYRYRFNWTVRWLRGWLSFLRGCRVAYRWRQRQPTHIHAQFPMEAATSAMVAARVLDIPWSFTSHTSSDPPLMREKLRTASFSVSITYYDKANLIAEYGQWAGDKLCVIHQGIYPQDWAEEERTPRWPPIIISVGTLAEKKGHRFLIESCRLLRNWGCDFQCCIIGDGPLRSQLERQILASGLSGTVSMEGAVPNPKVKTYMTQSSILCLPCIRAKNGDTDGLPIVLMEAMATGLPVVSTRMVGIPELVADGTHGFLVPPEDADSLAQRIKWLLDNPQRGLEMGARGRDRVCQEFNVRNNVATLADQIRKLDC